MGAKKYVCGQSKHVAKRFKYFVPPTPNEELNKMRLEMRLELMEFKNDILKAVNGRGGTSVGEASVDLVEDNINASGVNIEEKTKIQEVVEEVVSLGNLYSCFIHAYLFTSKVCLFSVLNR